MSCGGLRPFNLGDRGWPGGGPRPGASGRGCRGQLSSIRICRRSMSRRRCWCRSMGTSLSPPSGLGEGGRAPGPGQRVGAVRAGHGGEHGEQLGPQRGEPLDLGADLGDVAAQQGFGGLAGAGAGVADGEQLADLGQPQPEAALGAADEQQPVQVGRKPVPAVVAAGAPREQAAGLPARSTGSCPVRTAARAASCPTVSGSVTCVKLSRAATVKPWTALQVQAPPGIFAGSAFRVLCC